MKFVTIRVISVFVATVACAIGYGFSNAQESPPEPSPAPASLSPDKKWEYSNGEAPKLIKAGTAEVALEFLEQCDLGAVGEHSAALWAPDSKRLAFYSCGAGKEHLTLLYQLRDDQWVALKTPGDEDDELFQRAHNIVEAQAKKKHLPKGTSLHMQAWTVEPERWLDPNTLVVYAWLAEVARRYEGKDAEYAGLAFGTELLLTLKFDAAGNWKIIKTHRMSDKESEKREKEVEKRDKEQ